MSEMASYEMGDLPEYINLTEQDLETYWQLWINWRATGMKFLPSQLVLEPEKPLAVVLELDSIYAVIEKQISDQKAKSAKQETE